MNFKKFALGLRFAVSEHEPHESAFFWSLLFAHLPTAVTEGLQLHGIVDTCADREPENAYVCVFSNASIKRGKRLFQVIQADSHLCSYLTVYRPYVQTNKLETYPEAEYLGKVQEDGCVTGGDVRYSSMRFNGKQMPRLRSSKRLCVLLAPDSFKGTITSAEVTRHLSRAVYRHMPLATVVPCLTADGGEGTMDAIICPRDGRYATCAAHDCLGEPINARYGVLPDQTIVIEAATTCGFREQGRKRDIMRATSFGLGEMIAHVLDHGYRKIEIALGGTAINDGGMGMLCALGVRFLDKAGSPLEGNGENLIHIASIDLSALHPAIHKATLISLCDVQNPLLGETGSSYVYARQKGASDAQIQVLEQGMTNYAERTLEATGLDCAGVPGLGAAGGLGYALHVYCKASVASGIEAVLQESGFLRRLSRASLVITGEGSFDEQSIQFGKTVQGILNHCQSRNVPLAIISGRSEQGISKLMPVQGWGAITCVHSPITEKFSRQNAIPLLDEAADHLFRLLRLGMKLGWKYPILLAEGETRNENG